MRLQVAYTLACLHGSIVKWSDAYAKRPLDALGEDSTYDAAVVQSAVTLALGERMVLYLCIPSCSRVPSGAAACRLTYRVQKHYVARGVLRSHFGQTRCSQWRWGRGLAVVLITRCFMVV